MQVAISTQEGDGTRGRHMSTCFHILYQIIHIHVHVMITSQLGPCIYTHIARAPGRAVSGTGNGGGLRSDHGNRSALHQPGADPAVHPQRHRA